MVRVPSAVLLAVILPAALACAEGPVGVTGNGAPERTPGRVVAYRCDGGPEIVAAFESGGEGVWLFLPGRGTKLPRVETAGEPVYADGEVTFRPGRDRAVLVFGGEEYLCREDRRRSVVEGVKLRGGDFWATGNEPGWTLELYPGRAVLVTDYGRERFEIPLGPAEKDRRAGTTTWRGSAGGHELTVVLRGGGPCRDTMSGEVFETHVMVTLDGRVLSGCGMALH